MTDRPILFSAPMIRALLDGRKTQTRRVVTDVPASVVSVVRSESGSWQGVDAANLWACKLPLHFAKGDRLWVRETHYRFGHWEPIPGVRTKGRRQKWKFVADSGEVLFDQPAQFRKGRHHSTKESAEPYWYARLARFMPRSMSRLTLTVTDVRVQRLQEISEADAVAEGATERPNCAGLGNRESGWCMDWSRVGQPSKWANDGKTLSERDVCLATARHAFGNFIDVINGIGAWDANPWVVALSFNVERRNIDALPRTEP